MAIGAWDFFAFIWNHPIISCLVLLLFTPTLFPIVVYFSPLLISTALCAIALVSMNMGESTDAEDDFASRWQAEHAEAEQSKPAQEGWFRWMRKAEDKARFWVDGRFSSGKQNENWSVHDDEDGEHGVHVLPLPVKPTKIKYGEAVEEDPGASKEFKATSNSMPSLFNKEHSNYVAEVGGRQEREISGADDIRAQNGATSKSQPREQSSNTPAKVHEGIDTLAVPSRKFDESLISSDLHTLAQAGRVSDQSLASKPLPRSHLTVNRESEEEEGRNPHPPAVTGEKVVLGGDEVSMSHALATSGEQVSLLRDGTSALSALSSSNVSVLAETAHKTIDVGQSLPRNLVVPYARSESENTARSSPETMVFTAGVQNAVAAQLLPSNLVSFTTIAQKVTTPSMLEAKPKDEGSAPSVLDAELLARASVPVRTPPMKERVAEARMMKPEPSAYDVSSEDAGGSETDAMPVLRTQERVAEESATTSRTEGEHTVPNSNMSHAEAGRQTSGEVDTGTKLHGSNGTASIESDGVFFDAPDSDENAVSDRSNEFERVIFVDESSKLGGSAIASFPEQGVVADVDELHSEVSKRKSSSRTDGCANSTAEGKLSMFGSAILRTRSQNVDERQDVTYANLSVGLTDKDLSREQADDNSQSVALGDSWKTGSMAISTEGEGMQGNTNSLDDDEFIELPVGSTAISSEGNEAEKQLEERLKERSLMSESSNGSINGDRSVMTGWYTINSRLDESNKLQRSPENRSSGDAPKNDIGGLVTTESMATGSTTLENLKLEQQEDVSQSDQSLDMSEHGRKLEGLDPVFEVEGSHKIVPGSHINDGETTVSGSEMLQQVTPAQRNEPQSSPALVGIGGAQVSGSPDHASGSESLERNEEYEDDKGKAPVLKKSSSMPMANRQVEDTSHGAPRSTSMRKAALSKRVEEDSMSSDTDDNGDVRLRRKVWPRMNNSMDSVEEITARLSKKYTPTWTKPAPKEVVNTNKSISASVATDIPDRVEPVISFSQESVIVPMRRVPASEKAEKVGERYVSPIRRVMSAVRNVGNKDGSGKNGLTLPPERKGLSSVLSSKRDKLILPLKKVFSSDPGGDKRVDSITEEVATASAIEGYPLPLPLPLPPPLPVPTEDNGTDEKPKDRSISPLRKVVSSVPNEDKMMMVAFDEEQELQESASADKQSQGRASADKQPVGKDEVVADKFRDRFLAPLKKKLSSESNGGKKLDSTMARPQSPKMKGLFGRSLSPKMKGVPPPIIIPEIDLGPSTSGPKSPEKRSKFSWPRKRAKDDLPLHESRFTVDKTESPAILEKSPARVISHGRSNSSAAADIVEETTGYATDEFHSPERNYFWTVGNQEEKAGGSALLSKEKVTKPSSSHWWSRKREKAPEAAEANRRGTAAARNSAAAIAVKQAARDLGESTLDRIIGNGSVNIVGRNMAIPSSRLKSTPERPIQDMNAGNFDRNQAANRSRSPSSWLRRTPERVTVDRSAETRVRSTAGNKSPSSLPWPRSSTDRIIGERIVDNIDRIPTTDESSSSPPWLKSTPDRHIEDRNGDDPRRSPATDKTSSSLPWRKSTLERTIRDKSVEDVERNNISEMASTSLPWRSTTDRSIEDRDDDNEDKSTPAAKNVAASSWMMRHDKDDACSVRSSPGERTVYPSVRTHRREHSDSLPTRFRNHERRNSLSELEVADIAHKSPERKSVFDKSASMPSAHDPRERIGGLRAEALLFKSRSDSGVDHAEEPFRNRSGPSRGSRLDPEVDKLYRNLDSPSNVEIKITDKLKVPLEEVLSLLAVGDSSMRNSTTAQRESSSSSEETSSSEEEWLASSDEDEAGAVPPQNVSLPFHSRKSQQLLNKGNRQLHNVDA